jgi:hypothetical protein
MGSGNCGKLVRFRQPFLGELQFAIKIFGRIVALGRILREAALGLSPPSGK